ncbi:MAG: fructose-bisphosphatase class III [Ruminiclostridium sp.]|nr:fructose-bisphosphatase class III [Ruminiclostridium sp.]
MIYVMSDIHGMYEKYKKMLKLIELSDKDTLYIIGDVVDRGDEPVRILQDMMQRPNVIPLLGNHELLALNALSAICDFIDSNGSVTDESLEFNKDYLLWQMNGCLTTMEGLGRMNTKKRREIIRYMRSFPLHKTINVGDNTFILVHAGFENFSKDRSFDDYRPEELVWCRHNPDERYFEDENTYVVSGHTPVQKFTGKPYILHKNNNIFIDCGACLKGGKLACIRLDDFMEYYA